MDFYNIEKNTFVTETVLSDKGMPVDDLGEMLTAGYAPVRYYYPEYAPYTESIVAKTLSLAHYNVDEGVYVQEFDVMDAPVCFMPTIDELADKIRGERDKRITACDWVITRHRDEIDEGSGTTLTTTEYAAWLAYRKALRDLPSADGFPWDGGGTEAPWPVEPTL